ncbi:MAG: class F sortase [Candidatus Microbacterium colombiense]|nr:MAG: class F sortase [Microbacterium sp.]
MPGAGRFRGLAAAVAFIGALALSGCGTAGAVEATATPAHGPSGFSAGALQDPAAPAPDVAQSEPLRVQIPAIDVDTTLEHLTLDPDGRLAAPVDFDRAGWYAEGVAPGDVGPSIIAGHVDSPSAPAVFAEIDALVAGDDILVTMADGSVLTFVVSGTAQSAKADFPTASVYSNVPTPELRLITCGGVFDSSTGHYLDNLIVFADLRG